MGHGGDGAGVHGERTQLQHAFWRGVHRGPAGHRPSAAQSEELSTKAGTCLPPIERKSADGSERQDSGRRPEQSGEFANSGGQSDQLCDCG